MESEDKINQTVYFIYNIFFFQTGEKKSMAEFTLEHFKVGIWYAFNEQAHKISIED